MLTATPKVPGKSWSFSEGLVLDWQSSLVKYKPCLECPIYAGLGKSLTYSHTWLGLNLQIGRRIVVPFFLTALRWLKCFGRKRLTYGRLFIALDPSCVVETYDFAFLIKTFERMTIRSFLLLFPDLIWLLRLYKWDVKRSFMWHISHTMQWRVADPCSRNFYFSQNTVDREKDSKVDASQLFMHITF
jgi:hypothetical protein